MLIQEKGLSSNTAHKHHDLLNLTLKRAVIQGLLNVNPAERVEVTKKVMPEIHFYTQDELEKLFQLVTGTRLEVMVLLAKGTTLSPMKMDGPIGQTMPRTFS